MQGLKNVRHRQDDALARTHWASVEALLAEYYRGQGWQVDHCGTGANGACFDGGIDLKLRHDDQYVLVQCKHWNAKQVPHNEVHQLLGLMVNEGATGAVLVTSGEFTRVAREAAQKLGHVQLVDGEGLRAMVGPLPEPVEASVDRPAEVVFRSRGAAVQRRTHTGGRAWLLAAAVGLLVFAFIIRALLLRTSGTAGQTPLADTFVQPSNQPAEDEPVHYIGEDEIKAAAADRCEEMIDAPSDTYIDHCTSTKPLPRPSEAEIRASQRRAAEAMKIIEATTPEM